MISLRVQKELLGTEGSMQLNLALKIDKGQLVTLYGPSGAGKTSTLRILSGLMKPEEGEIEVNGKIWFDSAKKINLKPQQRNIGYVFQDYALFPNMTVLENLEFALDKNQNPSTVAELIEIMELGELKQRSPDTLSGGQKQRAALARALVRRPEILLLDEPLSALDIKIRLKLQDYIVDIHRQFGLTTILISHDIGEIHKLSDWVFVLEKGQLSKQGSPEDVFLNRKLSGKFKFEGEILKIEREDVVFIVTMRIQSQLVKVIAEETEISGLVVGDKVVVASKAFNPVIYKVQS